MYPINSLVDGTLTAAIDVLAKTATARRNTVKLARQKAASWDELGTKLLSGAKSLSADIGTHVQQNPTAAATLLGGGLGAAAGGLGTALANRGRPSHKRKGVLGAALTGGLAGAAVGGGLGLAGHSLQQLRTPASPPKAPTEFSHGGKTYSLDPQALAENPDLLSQVNTLEEPTARDAVSGGIKKTLGAVRDNTPWRTWLGMGAVDAGLNNKHLRPGERFGFGRIRPEFSTNPEHLERGLELNTTHGMPDEARLDLLKDRKKLDSLGRDQLQPSNAGRDVHSIDVPHPPIKEKVHKVDANKNVVENVFHEIETPNPKPPKRISINDEQIRRAKRLGAEAMHSDAGKPLSGSPNLWRAGKKTITMPRGRGANVLGRLAAYGVPFVAQHMYPSSASQSAKAMDKIMQSLREKNLIKEIGGPAATPPAQSPFPNPVWPLTTH